MPDLLVHPTPEGAPLPAAVPCFPFAAQPLTRFLPEVAAPEPAEEEEELMMMPSKKVRTLRTLHPLHPSQASLAPGYHAWL